MVKGLFTLLKNQRPVAFLIMFTTLRAVDIIATWDKNWLVSEQSIIAVNRLHQSTDNISN